MNRPFTLFRHRRVAAGPGKYTRVFDAGRTVWGVFLEHENRLTILVDAGVAVDVEDVLRADGDADYKVVGRLRMAERGRTQLTVERLARPIVPAEE